MRLRLIIPLDEYFFKYFSTKMNTTNNQSPKVDSITSSLAIKRAIDTQRAAFVKYENNDAVAISPDDSNGKKRAASPGQEGEEMMTREVTKTIKDEDGVTAAVITTTETLTKPAVSSSSKLPRPAVHAFTGVDAKSKVVAAVKRYFL